MAKFQVFVTLCVVFVATSLSVPLIDTDASVVDEGQQAVILTSADGTPELVVTGNDLGRANINKVTQLLNFTSYLDNRPPNVSALTFVPLITVLAGLSGSG